MADRADSLGRDVSLGSIQSGGTSWGTDDEPDDVPFEAIDKMLL